MFHISSGKSQAPEISLSEPSAPADMNYLLQTSAFDYAHALYAEGASVPQF